MKTNFKITLAAIIGFVAGGSAGFFFQTADTTEDSAKGDIAKVSKFSRNVVSPAMSAFQEKITSNPEELEKATFSLTVLTSRMTEFDELVKIASAVSEGNEELSASVKYLQRVSQLAANARTNGTQALGALNAIAEGKQSSVDYEQASQNLALAFMMVDRQINVGKQYVCDVDAFLRGKNVEDYKELALARDLWAGYCAGEAVLTNNSEELAYWSKQQNLLSSGTDVLADHRNSFVIISDVLKQCQMIDRAIGIAGEGSFFISTDPVRTSKMFSNNEQFNTVVAVHGWGLVRMNEGISQTFNVDQMMQNVLSCVSALAFPFSLKYR